MRLLIVIFTAATFNSSSATEFFTEPAQGTVVFKASALGLRFDGKGQGVSGVIKSEKEISGVLTFALATLDTGIEMRNTHMKEKYLEIEKYPNGKLVITRVANFDLQANEQEADFEGLLTIRGVERPITNGHFKAVRTDSGFQVKATFATKISDFAIPLPKYAGVVVKDDLNIEANLHLKTKMN